MRLARIDSTASQSPEYRAAMDRKPLDVTEALPSLVGPGWRATLVSLLEEILGIARARESFIRAAGCGPSPYRASVDAFQLRVQAETSARIPPSGPVCVVANHPFGGADALALGAICESARPDFRMLANQTAAALPGISAVSLPLSILGNDENAARANAATLRKTLAHLGSGGCIGVFPAGEVARWHGHGVEEGPWLPQIIAIARRAGATLVPVKFHGHTPAWFHLLGAIHPLVRTALLPRLLLAAAGKTIRYTIGIPVPAADYAHLDPQDFSKQLRANTLAIREP